MRFVVRGIWIVVLVIIFTAASLFVWSSLPIQVNREQADPATLHLNVSAPDAPQFVDAYFEHQGHQLHYVEAGQGDPIVFIHGFPSFWFSFVRQASELRLDHRVILIDGLGVGKSDAPGDVDAYRLENMTAHVNALLDELGIKQAHFVGHDWGSAMVLGFAQRYPSRVRTVTGIAAPPQNVMLSSMQKSELQRQASTYIEQLKQANAPLLILLQASKRTYEGAYKPLVDAGKLSSDEGDLFRDAVGRTKRINAHINWYRANIPAADEISESDFWPSRDARIEAPTLFVLGSEDPIITKDTVTALTSISDSLTVMNLEGVGHWPHVEQAETVTSAIRDLLATWEPK